jgi:hypothetical protein
MSEEHIYGWHQGGAQVCVTCGGDYFPDTAGAQRQCEFCLMLLAELARNIRARTEAAIAEFERTQASFDDQDSGATPVTQREGP